MARSLAKETQKTYLAIAQPPLRPPPQVFGPVWTALYGLMGYAAHRAVTTGLSPPPAGPSVSAAAAFASVHAARHAAMVYSLQLGLNFAWMPLFFGAKRPALALADMVVLLAANGYLAYRFFALDRVAGWCYVPYVAWLAFATYLNVGVGYLNDWNIKDKEVKKQ